MIEKTVKVASSLRGIMASIIDVGSLQPSKRLGESLKSLTELVYGDDSSAFSSNEKKHIVQTLKKMPVSAEQSAFLTKHVPENKGEGDNILSWIQLVSVQAEIEHDKYISTICDKVSTEDLENRLDFLNDNRADSEPSYLKLDELGEPKWQGAEEQYKTRMAVFAGLRSEYPYNWAGGRAESEMIAMEHIVPEGVKAGDTVVYIGSSAPDSAFAMIATSALQGKQIKTLYVDDDLESVELSQKVIDRLVQYGAISEGDIKIAHAKPDQIIDYKSLLGQVPIVGVVTAAISDKLEAATALKSSGVDTINILSTQGMAELMYSRFDVDSMSREMPLRGAVLPGHIDERLSGKQDIGTVNPDENVEKRFWVTPLFFSEHEWQSGKGHERVTDPQKATFASKVRRHPRYIPPSKNIAIVTSENTSDIMHQNSEDRLVALQLRAKNIGVEGAVWSDPSIDWKQFDMVVIRSTYDYKDDPEKFTAWLDKLDDENIPVLNGTDLIKWNMHKQYLLDIGVLGGNVIPTDILSQGTDVTSADLMSRYGWDGVVIKPAIGSGGADTMLLSAESDVDLKRLLTKGDVIVQPFMPEIYNGEYSLIYYNGELSHSVLKQPNGDEFRVHEKFGGSTEEVNLSPQLLVDVTKLVERVLPDTPYVRVDGIMSSSEFMIMELECIEPWMYFNDVKSPEKAAQNFATTIEGELNIAQGRSAEEVTLRRG